MFPKDQRITKKENFNNIYKKGKSLFIGYFKVFIMENSLKKIRLSVVVSKKVLPLATQRNQIKRKIKSFFYKNQAILPKNLDIIITINNKKALLSTQDDFKKIILKLKR